MQPQKVHKKHFLLSLGSTQNSWEEASEAVAESCAEPERALPQQAVINSDETGYPSGEKRWLWAHC